MSPGVSERFLFEMSPDPIPDPDDISLICHIGDRQSLRVAVLSYCCQSSFKILFNHFANKHLKTNFTGPSQFLFCK